MGRWQKQERIDDKSPEGSRVHHGEVREREDGIVLVTVDTREIGLVAPGAMAHIPFSAPIAWRAKSLSVLADHAARFSMLGMNCAMMTYVTYNGAPIPCSLFSDALCAECRKLRVADHLGVEWPGVHVGMILHVTVRNDSDLPSPFSMTFEAERIMYDAFPGL